VVLLPGSVATLTEETCTTSHPVADLDEFFANKPQYLQEYAQRQRPVIESLKLTWRHPEIDVLAGMKRRIEPLLDESIYLPKCRGRCFDLISYESRSVHRGGLPGQAGAPVRG
jgi:UDP-MurNAc hydroxylase